MKKIIGNLIFYGLSAILIFILLCQAGLLPMRFIYFRSGSMHPAYLPGDLAFVYMGKNIEVKVGDVVLFSAAGEPTLHRVINIQAGSITTKGDANPTPDPNPITHVDGKLLFAIPKIGYAIDFIQMPFRVLGHWIQGKSS